LVKFGEKVDEYRRSGEVSLSQKPFDIRIQYPIFAFKELGVATETQKATVQKC